jgi:hypothetical protein
MRKGQKHSEATKQKMRGRTGELSPVWKGGCRFLEYLNLNGNILTSNI